MNLRIQVFSNSGRCVSGFVGIGRYWSEHSSPPSLKCTLAPERVCSVSLRILLVEDETDFREGLRDLLNLQGFIADGVGSIGSYKAWRMTHSCDVLIIDRQLPDGDGLEIIRLHRQVDQVPVIVLTARGQLDERIAGLDADADHYLVKPIASSELIALLRRIERRAAIQQQAANWILDPVGWRLCSPCGDEVELTRRELAFLANFVEKPGLPVPRQEIILNLDHDPALYDPRRLEVMVRRLRNKVEEATPVDFPLTTIYGVGYAFNGSLAKR